jgi:hypothetical protein
MKKIGGTLEPVPAESSIPNIWQVFQQRTVGLFVHFLERHSGH